MPEISLTDFVEFVIKAGTPKLTVVNAIKQREPYQPAFDFWKPLREGIVDFHKKGKTDKQSLDVIAAALADPKKRSRYPAAVAGYKKFLGKKMVSWFPPPTSTWSSSDLEVRVNPELGLKINGENLVVKLYFKDDSPTKSRLQVVLELMRIALAPLAASARMAVLDVGNAKLTVLSPAGQNLQALLQGEAASFIQIWNSL